MRIENYNILLGFAQYFTKQTKLGKKSIHVNGYNFTSLTIDSFLSRQRKTLATVLKRFFRYVI